MSAHMRFVSVSALAKPLPSAVNVLTLGCSQTTLPRSRPAAATAKRMRIVGTTRRRSPMANVASRSGRRASNARATNQKSSAEREHEPAHSASTRFATTPIPISAMLATAVGAPPSSCSAVALVACRRGRRRRRLRGQPTQIMGIARARPPPRRRRRCRAPAGCRAHARSSVVAKAANASLAKYRSSHR